MRASVFVALWERSGAQCWQHRLVVCLVHITVHAVAIVVLVISNYLRGVSTQIQFEFKSAVRPSRRADGQIQMRTGSHGICEMTGSNASM